MSPNVLNKKQKEKNAKILKDYKKADLVTAFNLSLTNFKTSSFDKSFIGQLIFLKIVLLQVFFIALERLIFGH